MSEAIHEIEGKEAEYSYVGHYELYLKTKHWNIVRNYMFDKYNHKCELCGSNGKLNVHHFTYENMGQEREEDLICLCAKCHTALHNNNFAEMIDSRETAINYYNEYKKILNSMNNEAYMYLLPLFFSKLWNIEQISALWGLPKNKTKCRLKRYESIGLIGSMKIEGNKETYYYLLRTLFTWIMNDYPKVPKLLGSD